jgi:hypothetical protein
MSDDEVPADIADALNGIPDLDIEKLRDAAREVLSPQELRRLEALGRKAQNGGLSAAEQKERDELSHRYERPWLCGPRPSPSCRGRKGKGDVPE